MITRIHIRNFKSLVEQEFSLSNLNLLTGINSSGKSSLIQALRMIDKGAALPGHGDFSDLRSKGGSSSGDPAISLEIENDGGQIGSVRFSNTQLEIAGNHPKRIIEKLIYVSADRLGPQAQLPTTGEDHTISNVGERSEYGKLYELQNKLKGFNVYFEEEVNEFCRFFFSSRKRLNPKDHLHHEFGADDEPHYFCTGLPVGVNNDLVSPWIKNRASRGPGIRSFRNPFDGWSNRLVSFFSIGVPHHRQALPRLAFNTSPLFTTLNK